MRYFFGLGNPGDAYCQTRHNVGQMCIEYISRGCPNYVEKKKLKSNVSHCVQRDCFFIKPTTFMNESGLAVKSFLSFYKVNLQLEKEQIYLLYDDLDIALGSYKIQYGRGPKVHNGLNSVVAHVQTDQFFHVRIGVDGRAGQRNIPARNYVLQSFSQDELQTVDHVCAEIKKQIFPA